MNDLLKMSSTVSTPELLSGNIGAKTINVGVKGDDGATFVPSVSADGVISWTNDKDLPNPEPVNIKGDKGEKGDNGTTNYSELENKPSINGVELSGNKTGEELGLVPDLSGFATKEEIPVVPEALPNPNALTFTGAVNATYDGSQAVSVEIPSGGGGGEFELVEHCLLEEDCKNIELTFSKEYKKIYFAIKLVNGSTATNIEIITFPALNNYRQFYFSSQASATKYHALYIECEAEWRKAYGVIGVSKPIPPLSNSSDQSSPMSNIYINIFNRNIIADSRSMNGIRFSGTTFAIGTEIYIYGIPD